MMHPGRWARFLAAGSALAALLVAPGCGLMGLFDEPIRCTTGEQRTTGNACGACDAGTLTEECGSGGRWEFVSCDNPFDHDVDGIPNASCGPDCCTAARDCNDGDAAVHPETFDCVGSDARGAAQTSHLKVPTSRSRVGFG
jgi:hypothetical protein